MELVKFDGVKFDVNGLSLTERMDLEKGADFAVSLGKVESASSWWIGDFLLGMEALHGEPFAQVIPEGKASSWLVYHWVSERVKPTTRRQSLSFSHHQVVASLLTERQNVFLDKAEAEALSVSSLKKLIAKEKGKVEESKLIDRECPSCGWKWQEVEK